LGKHTEKIRHGGGFSAVSALGRNPGYASVQVIWFLLFVGLFSACSPARRAIRQERAALPPNFYHLHSQELGFRLTGKEDPLLISEVASWLRVPYRFGGNTRAGADCSGFVFSVYRNAHQIELPRTTEGQARLTRRVGRNRLKVGDLVFFRTTSRRKVTHVGIYLGKDKFIHASTSRGVIVSDLNEPYFARSFRYGGRVRLIQPR
jgi:murein DD-endopeptidase / murein LD-carboxypeptidase